MTADLNKFSGTQKFLIYIERARIGITVIDKHWRSLLVVGICLFWILRIAYWSGIHEAPFSDMGNFNNIAHNIIKNGSFAWSPFWQTYTQPTLVLLRAIQIWIFGESLLIWRIFQTTILFSGLLWLLFELKITIKRNTPVLIFLYCVALSKSSIFWSYKLSRESIGEAFIYICIASILWALRKNSFITFFWVGVIFILAAFNKTHYLLNGPIFFLGYFILIYLANREEFNHKKSAILLIAFGLGFVSCWAPWILRSYQLYGRFLPLTTEGPYCFLWTLGDFEVRDDGELIRTNVKELQGEASKRFKNDYEASRYAVKLSKLWLQENWKTTYPELYVKRLIQQIVSRDIYLTRVSRVELFRSKVLNLILIDKYPVLICFGVIGILVLIFIDLSLLAFFAVIYPPFFIAPLLMGYPRMIESMIPTLIWANVFLIYFLAKKIIQKLEKNLSYSASQATRG